MTELLLDPKARLYQYVKAFHTFHIFVTNI